jgi:beta-xylosidase
MTYMVFKNFNFFFSIMKNQFLMVFLFAVLVLNAQSKVWVSDLGNGKFKNPVLYADYSDPDVCRAGDDYWMTASSFNCSPGLPVLHSKDMINWRLVNYAIQKQYPLDVFDKPQHGNGVWAPCIRFHEGEFYIFYGDPDYGIYMLKTKNPEGKWSDPVLVKAGKGLIDPSPFWDEDGKLYVSHAYAGSRAGLKSVLAIFECTSDASKAVTESKLIFDGHVGNSTIEGTKFHKRNGYYYILAPAGGVATGWQLALRSKSVYGPYETKMVLHQGKTDINGPHQGAWVDTPKGEDWFFHFQDLKEYGRIVHLQPMVWKNDWPVIGLDKDGDGCGEPVSVWRKPDVGKIYPVSTPPESDEFNENKLGLQWQWHANEQVLWSFTDASKGVLRLFSYPVPEQSTSLWQQPNLLLQKFPAPEFTVTTKISFHPDSRYFGEKAGLLIMGYDYAHLQIENTDKGFILSQNACKSANKSGKEVINASVSVQQSTVYFRVKVSKGGKCNFSYSLDEKKFISLGNEFQANSGQWIGAKAGFFITRPKPSNDGGWIDVDWFRIEK